MRNLLQAFSPCIVFCIFPSQDIVRRDSKVFQNFKHSFRDPFRNEEEEEGSLDEMEPFSVEVCKDRQCHHHLTIPGFLSSISIPANDFIGRGLLAKEIEEFQKVWGECFHDLICIGKVEGFDIGGGKLGER